MSTCRGEVATVSVPAVGQVPCLTFVFKVIVTVYVPTVLIVATVAAFDNGWYSCGLPSNGDTGQIGATLAPGHNTEGRGAVITAFIKEAVTIVVDGVAGFFALIAWGALAARIEFAIGIEEALTAKGNLALSVGAHIVDNITPHRAVGLGALVDVVIAVVI